MTQYERMLNSINNSPAIVMEITSTKIMVASANRMIRTIAMFDDNGKQISLERIHFNSNGEIISKDFYLC